MHELPMEIINYCLLYADTGTKLIYNKNEKKLKMMYDFTHSKYNSLLRLFSQREIQIDENIIHVHLPWLYLSNYKKYKKYFAANITIYDNECVLWNSHIIFEDENKPIYLLYNKQ
jgi:hypothetical protein